MDDALTAQPLSDYHWRVEPRGAMKVPIQGLGDVDSPSPELLQQLAQLASLPGVVDSVWALPGARHGVFAPEGAIFATDPDTSGVVVPSVVGDSLGTGTLALRLSIGADRLQAHGDEIRRTLIPSRFGNLSDETSWEREGLTRLFTEGARGLLGERIADTIDGIASVGTVVGADPAVLSEAARLAGQRRLGSWSGGDRVDLTYDASTGDVVLFVRGGNGGLPTELHRTARRVMSRAAMRYALRLPGPQFRCAPVHSHEGREYLAGMASVLNFASANRLIIAARYLDALSELVGESVRGAILGDHGAWGIRFEVTTVNGNRRRLCVHQLGAMAMAPEPTWYPIGTRGDGSWVGFQGVGVAEAEARALPAEASDWEGGSTPLSAGTLGHVAGRYQPVSPI